MASRRMKMKVAVNVGRGGRVSGPGTATTDKGRPTTPVQHEVLVPLSPSAQSAPRSPVKNFHGQFQFTESGQSSFPPSPTKSQAPPPVPSPGRKSVSESEPEDHALLFHEDEVSGLELVPFQERGKSPAPLGIRSVSPVKGVTPLQDESQRGPGTGPSLGPSSNMNIMTNIQKEIGPVHAAHVTSNETLRQRLQKGTSSHTTKYSILRKEFLVTNKNKTPDKKDLTILHFTFWNPPSEEGSNKPEGEEDFYEGIDTSVMNVAEELSIPTSPVPASEPVEEEPKKPVGPRVKVGPDGELVIDEQSLIVETSESVRAKKQLSQMETVMAASSGYYRHKRVPKRGNDWTVKETVRFYKALTMCGTDFSMMTHLFPTRTRAELKAKFKREDRKNSVLVSQALSCQTFDPMEPMTESEEESEPEPPAPKKRRSSVKEKEGPFTTLNIIEDAAGKEKEQQCSSKETKDDEEVPIDKLQHPASVGFCPPPKDPTVAPDSSSELCPKRKGRKPKVTPKTEKLSTLPGFTTGRPMGLGDIGRVKAMFKAWEEEEPTVRRKRDPPPAKPKATRKRTTGRKNRVIASDSDQSDVEPPAALTEGESQDSTDPRLAILRFDASDPLGLKVVQNQAIPETIEDRPDLGSNENRAVDPVETPLEDTQVNVLRAADEENATTQPIPAVRSTRSTRSTKVKVKPRTPRVPGGGGRVVADMEISPVPGGDEIEIEISCL